MKEERTVEKMKMVFPTLEYKEKAIAYIQEFIDYDSEINGAGGLSRYLEESTYEEWLKKVIAAFDIANIEKPHVPGMTYFYVRESDDQIVGMCNLRLALNDFLRTEGGSIGYGIRPTERQKGYATAMLKDALKVYEMLGIKDVYITCDSVNVASAKVAMNNGGILEAEFYSETYKQDLQRYVIHLNE